jgi:hypothetical protein
MGKGSSSLLAVTAGPALAAAGGANLLVEEVRAANDRFNDVSVAVAEGYKPIACASGIEGGSMGIHYVNESHLKNDAIDLAHPEAVMYEPSAGGQLTLIGVEYITSKGPAELNGTCSASKSLPTAMAWVPFTSFMFGPGKRTGKALSQT